MDVIKEILADILKQYIGVLNRTIRKNVKELGVLAMILYVMCMVMWCDSPVYSALITLAFLFVKDLMKSIYYKINGISESDGLPTRSKRFTHIDKYGFIEINEEDKMEMIQYLYEIENFIEKKKKSIDTKT